jgi:NADPH:quinone reductase
MRAAVYTGAGGPEVISIQDVPRPEPGADEALVRVLASGLNRADLQQRQGRYPAPPGAPADVPGLEFVGVVDDVGRGATFVKAGQRVLGLTGGGGQAEFVVSHERLLVAVPDALNTIQAGAVPEAFITAHDALFTQAELVPGERVLIHAAASGVGTVAVQLAHAAGCSVFATTRTPAKIERIEALGADVVIDTSHEDFAQAVARETGGEGVHVLIDFIGGAYLAQNLAALALKGRLVEVGTLSGAAAEIDLGVVLRKRLHLVGTALRGRPLEEKIAATRLFAEHALPQIARGLIRPVVDRVFPLDQLAEAHRYMTSNEGFGKIVIQIAGD